MNYDYANVPYYAHEGDMARLERANKHMLIALFMEFVALVVIIIKIGYAKESKIRT